MRDEELNTAQVPERDALYEAVWKDPVTIVAARYGLSDVGLAKMCRKLQIPLPVRGYWAKVKAGKIMKRPALPPLRAEVTPAPLPERNSRESGRKQDAQQAEHARVVAQTDIQDAERESGPSSSVFVLPLVLVRPHPLVAVTKNFCDRLPKLIAAYERRSARSWPSPAVESPPHLEYGRYCFFKENGLNITASLESMDWTLRFHDAFLKVLAAQGMKAEWKSGDRRARSREDQFPHVILSKSNESFRLEWVQGYRRIKLSDAEFLELKKEKSWASQYVYEAADRFSLRVTGSEYRSRKVWEFSAKKMQELLPDLVADVLAMVALQRDARAERERKEAEARKRAEEEASRQRKRQAREEILRQALGIAETHDRLVRLNAYLEDLEQRRQSFEEPFKERVGVWIRVVREELAQSDPEMTQLATSIKGASWRPWPPDWWPEEGGE